MKNIIFLFIFICTTTFGQSEKDEKLNKINKTKINNTESTEKITQRNNNYNQTKSTYIIPNNTRPTSIYRNNSYYNWWSWGAPYSGFIGFSPSFYYDRFGMRQPMRVYEMSDGSKKNIKGKKTNYRLGLGYGYKNNLSFWSTIGKKSFFMVEYSDIIQNDQSTFYYNITMDEVIRWQDRRLDDITHGGAIYLGGGTKFSKLGAYIMGGYAWEIKNFQFFDELYLLSNNGKYSIRDYDNKFFTGKVGLIYDYKYLTIKSDYDLFRNIINLGFGVVI
jgi:hypothetical protein